MLSTTHGVGVDPGLVHTGIVRLAFLPAAHEIHVSHTAVNGQDTNGDPLPPEKIAQHANDWILNSVTAVNLPDPLIYIEGYRPRSHFSTDSRMAALCRDLKVTLDAPLLLNTGVKAVVKRPLMELLGVWSFTTITHHQDLRSAARILLLGMLKRVDTNALLTEVVRSHLRGEDWAIINI